MDTLILIKSKPDTESKAADGLRITAAMIGMDHIPDLVFIDDGIECLLHGKLDGVVLEYLNAVSNLVEIHVLSESLKEKNLKPGDLRGRVTLIDIDRLTAIMKERRLILAF